MPRESASNPESRREVIASWIARLLTVSVVLSGLDTAVTLMIGSMPSSDALGFVLALVLCAGTYLAFGLPLAIIGALFDRRLAKLLALDTSRLAAGALATLVGAAVIVAMVSFLERADIEFQDRVELARTVLVACVVAATLVLARFATPLLRLGAARAPNLAEPRIAVPVVAALAGLALFASAAFALAPVYLPRSAAIASAGALAAMLVGARAAAPVFGRRTRNGMTLAVVVLEFAALFACRNRHAAFTVFSRYPVAGALASMLRNAVDLDGDGAAATWLGGADCAEGNARVGPGQREIHGDGIDQDCRGGDAPVVPPRPEPANARLGCRADERLSVLLVTIDALRADAPTPKLMPMLSRLAADSVSFSRAYANVSSTYGSIPSIFSGRVPSDDSENPITRRVVNMGRPITQRLKDAGYRTAAFNLFEVPPAVYVGFEPAPVGRWQEAAAPKGIKGGFASAQITSAALDFELAMRDQLSFAWVHYPDVHAPYLDPHATDPALGELSTYQRELAYVDYHLGRLLAALESLGRLEHTLIIVTSDHGEDLAEQGKEGHGGLLYDTSIHVPLLMRVPGCPPAQVDWPVALAQIPATIGAIVDVPFEGLALYTPRPAGALPIVSEAINDSEGYQRAVVGERYKLILDVRNGGRVLFDLIADPHEERDIYRSNPRAAAEAEAQYQSWLDR